MVVNSGGQRNILHFGEKATLKNGDVLELIPGSHYFKYVSLCSLRNSDVSKGNTGGCENSDVRVGRKRAREHLNSQVSVEHSMVLPPNQISTSYSVYMFTSFLCFSVSSRGCVFL